MQISPESRLSLETPIGEEDDSPSWAILFGMTAYVRCRMRRHVHSVMLKGTACGGAFYADLTGSRTSGAAYCVLVWKTDMPSTLEEVGKEFNVTRERIRQIEAKALRKLRHPSRSRKLKDYLGCRPDAGGCGENDDIAENSEKKKNPYKNRKETQDMPLSKRLRGAVADLVPGGTVLADVGPATMHTYRSRLWRREKSHVHWQWISIRDRLYAGRRSRYRKRMRTVGGKNRDTAFRRSGESEKGEAACRSDRPEWVGF